MAKRDSDIVRRPEEGSAVSFSLPTSTADWDFLMQYGSGPLDKVGGRSLLYHLIGLLETTEHTLLTERDLAQPHIRVLVEVHDVA